MAEKFFFIVFAVLAVAGALGVITRSNIVHALLLLVFTFLNVSAIYLLTQASLILLPGGSLGGFMAVILLISRIQDFSAFGIAITPVWDLSTISLIALVTFLMAGIGVAIPAIKINSMTTPELLGRE